MISNLMLFIKLTAGGPFIQGQFFLNLQSFGFLERRPASDFQTASAGCLLNKSSLCS